MEYGQNSGKRNMNDPYSVLGLRPDASDEEVKKAYKTLAKRYHPDVTGNSPEAARKMQEINAAYDQIINHKESFSSSQSSYGGYSYGYGGYRTEGEDEPIELRAAVAYINARRFVEALNTLYGIPENKRSARWYYLAAYAETHTGDTTGALRDINIAIAKEPGNATYLAFRDRLTGRRTAYEDYSRSFGSFGTGFFPCCFPFFPCCCII